MIKKITIAAISMAFSVATAQTVIDPTLSVRQIISSGELNSPTSMVLIGSDDFLVSEKNTGQVRRVLNGTVLPGAVLDLPVNSEWERGLLGLALDPLFGTPGNDFLYLYYSRAESDGGVTLDGRISRFIWNGSSLIDEVVLLTVPDMFVPSHHGGILAFGPPNVPASDQKLFFVSGDKNQNNMNQNIAEGELPDDTSVILRINKDGSTPSGLDKGPFYDVSGANESLKRTYAYGFRNSFGMDFDPVTNQLWITENGPETSDEINMVLPGTNGGWKRVMGPSSRPDSVVTGSGLADLVFWGSPSIGNYSDPEFTWHQPNAPTAIHFVRGNSLGVQHANVCLVGCFRDDKLYRFPLNANRDGFVLTGDLADLVHEGPSEDDSQIVFGSGFGIITDIKNGQNNEVFILSMDTGTIYEITKRPASIDSDWHLFY